ncbi:growth hormone receptor b isoform X2 [Sphaeramia orbicularis]|uniref:Growth hormone receptor-like n=2 Tax=Sphaeramia orbicularis TaxID=375764 RepID=A0A673AQX2_9TELE|nr:growth hormone receptor-like isoform X2 [Sphaeramia orbicularis]
MAPALTTLLFFIYTFTVSALESTSEQVVPPKRPHITECFSANMETFRCRWSVGSFLNVSEPGDLRLFYVNKPSITKDWTECPHYSSDRPNECFFNENHTTVWTNYGVQLYPRDLSDRYDENHFNVYDIVRPDPPFSLTWTLLNVSLSGHFYDVMLNWKPPESADVQSGWMRLQYEVQHRDIDSDLWKVADLVDSTHRTLYGLETNVNHEVRVRCKMFGGKQFGEFSDSVLIHIPSKVSRFPVAAVLIFGALCLVAILMLVIISQQEKLMVLLLPPVPGPKIRGIDPELLKKGKLRELTSILGGPPDLRPELYNADPWVEFIDLDIEEHHDMLTDLDTHCLVDRSVTSGGSPVSIGFRDDDSGRASCCDPDLPSDAEASLFHPLIPNQMLREESPSEVPAVGEPPVPGLGREAMYTQVSEVRSSGKVILSPEEQTEVDDQHKDTVAGKEKEKKELRLVVENVDNSGYTSELNAGKMSPGDFSADLPLSTGDNQRPETTTLSPLHPAPVYTVVEGVDRQNSLLLTSNSTPAPQLIIPKPMPTPEGYLTPELFGSITP